MSQSASDSYGRLLTEWQARREVVNAYHRALRFLATDVGAAAQAQYQRRRDLNAKLASALVALREASDRLRTYEQAQAALAS